jgi:hypothetical protein
VRFSKRIVEEKRLGRIEKREGKRTGEKTSR